MNSGLKRKVEICMSRGSLVRNTILAGVKTFLIDSCQQILLETVNPFLFTIALYGKKIVCFRFIPSEV